MQATDLEAARTGGLALGAVSWGYGDFDLLRTLAPQAEFAGVADIRRLVW